MGSKSDIQFRMNMLTHESKMHERFKLNALERSRKLKSIEVTEGKVEARIRTLKSFRDDIDKELGECYANQNKLAEEKRHLDMVKSPIVSEHALLRYVERFWGIDLVKAHEEILLLPESEKVMAKRTVVTVFPDKEDSFNLCEREAE